MAAHLSMSKRYFRAEAGYEWILDKLGRKTQIAKLYRGKMLELAECRYCQKSLVRPQSKVHVEGTSYNKRYMAKGKNPLKKRLYAMEWLSDVVGL